MSIFGHPGKFLLCRRACCRARCWACRRACRWSWACFWFRQIIRFDQIRVLFLCELRKGFLRKLRFDLCFKCIIKRFRASGFHFHNVITKRGFNWIGNFVQRKCACCFFKFRHPLVDVCIFIRTASIFRTWIIGILFR